MTSYHSVLDCKTCLDKNLSAERKEKASALADRDSALNALFELGTAGIAEVDLRTGRFTRVNQRFCEIMRRDAATLLTLGPANVIHPDDRETVERSWKEAMKGPGQWEAEVRHVGPDGEVFWVRIGVSAWKRDAAGVPTCSVAVLQDVTDSVLAAEQLRHSSELMRLSQEIGKIGSFRRDLVTGLTVYSKEARQIFGIPPGDGPLYADAWLEKVLPEDRDRALREVRGSVDRRAPEVACEWRVPGGPMEGVRSLEMRARLYYTPEGEPKEAIGVVIDVTNRKAVEDRLAYAARHDALTGLANRALFQERTNQALVRSRRGDGFAVLCLDLDRFKDVNDTLGHAVGDALLIAASERIKAELRDVDLLARLGGDEFAILQHGATCAEAVIPLARRLNDCISEPFEIGGDKISVGVSIGVAMAPKDGAQYEALLKCADLALYQAKGEGRGRCRFFEPELNKRAQKRRALEVDLRRAMAVGEFELHYQPIVNVASRRIQGFEALARWRHPERGLVSPADFIPICEEIGLIAPFGAWALKQACADAAHWPKSLHVAVNLSPMQFTTGHLEADVAAALAESGLSAERLELEITESVLLSDSATTLATLHKLKSLGASIAMDDFGSGYSSLNYLQRFPFDKVKIDRVFTEALASSGKTRAIVRAIIELCGALNMATVSEGVETAEQLGILEGKGCDEAQGYLFGAAMPAAYTAELIERERKSGLSWAA